MAIAKGVRAVINGICVGITTVTTVRWANTAVSLADKQALANEIRDFFIPNFMIGCSASMNFVSIFITDDDNTGDSPYVLPINKVGSGTQGPTQVAVQLNLLSGVAGRRGRGRLFVPGIRDVSFPGSQLSSSLLLTGQNQINILKGRYCGNASTPWFLGVHSRKDNLTRPVVDITLNNLPSALRSRKVNVGI
jgi:hypothetical protein